MDISEYEQDVVLSHLDRARQILKQSKHDELKGDFRKAEIIDVINSVFHAVQLLNTQPY